jgi:hypothetical protein
MKEFRGYGNPKAPLWFIGMEEAGAGKEEILRRLVAWEQRGSSPFEHVANYHRAICVTANFDEPRPKIQSTWRGLMLVALASRGLPTDTESVRRFQATQWATLDGEECLTELFPLPKRSLKDWGYNEWSSRDDLRNSRRYYQTWLEPRLATLQDSIERYRPKVVVFYGSDYRRHWERVCGAQFESGELLARILLGQHRSSHTCYLFIPHTVARGLKNEDFVELGVKVRGVLRH